MRYIVALLLSLSVLGHGADRPEPAFEQDRFAIGFWVNPPMDELAKERYREVAEANFNVVIGGFSDPTQTKRLLKLCKRNGLKAIVRYRPDLGEIPDGPACWGYGLRDEPNAKDFPVLAEQVAALRQSHPGKLSMINLFPDYANAEQLGNSTYDAHVEEYMRVVQPDMLCMDHYPQFKPDRDGRDGYCRNLEVMRRHALANDVPFWNFFNIMPYGPHTDPTEDQVRWQIYASLSHGAKGVLYFCYYTPRSAEFPKGGAIIGTDNRKTRHYAQAQRLNLELKNLGPTLMQLTNTAVLRVSPEDTPSEVLAGSPITNIQKAKVDPGFDYLVSSFQHSDGRRAVMLFNNRFAYTAWPTIVFDADPKDIREVSKTTAAEIPVTDDSPDMDGLQLSLDAGEGRLFLLPAN
jgi:hypothetical protein